jgi:hypothetical protein
MMVGGGRLPVATSAGDRVNIGGDPAMRALRLSFLVALSLVTAVALLAGCSESTRPPASSLTDVQDPTFDAAVDPDGASFVLQVADTTDPAGPRLRVELIGSGITTDPAEQTLALDVAVKNVSEEPLHAPIILWIGRLRPSTVTVLDADRVADGPRYGYDYSSLLGGDETLGPGETSTARTWTFRDPDLAPFTFAARVEAPLPDRPAHIAGIAFLDRNENGQMDRGEHGMVGAVVMTLPDGSVRESSLDRSGRYAFRVETAGLYTLAYGSPFGAPMECFTTPNPLQVILASNENGALRSIDDADFGVKPGPCGEEEVRPAEMTDLRPEQIHQDPYRLLEAHLRGDFLVMRVSFGGCGPDHPFSLFISGAFMESNPVQTWALLSHDDLDEECDAVFERTLKFDLGPLRRAYTAAYGQPGPVVVRLRNFQGEEQRILFGP